MAGALLALVALTDGAEIVSQSFPLLPTHSRCRGCLLSFDHTQTHTTVGRSPMDEGSARRRDLYLTTQTLYKTNIHAPGEIRTHNPSKCSAAHLRLRPRGHWDRQYLFRIYFNIIITNMPGVSGDAVG
jgi:hypothetical protein